MTSQHLVAVIFVDRILKKRKTKHKIQNITELEEKIYISRSACAFFKIIIKVGNFISQIAITNELK